MASATLASPTPPSRQAPAVSYESFSPRSSEQESRLNRIAALTAGPTASSVTGSKAPPPPRGSANDSSLLVKAMMVPPYKHARNQITSSPAEMGSRVYDDIVEETRAEAIKKTDGLKAQLKHATSLRLALRASINIAEDISNRHADLIRHSGELSAAADRLQEEEALLTKHAAEIGMPLKHYDAVDRISLQVGVLFKGKSTVRGLAKMKVDDDEYPSLLDEIDDAVDYFGRECGGREALQEEMRRRSKDNSQLLSGNIEYYRRALALQEAALFLIKEAIVERVSNITAQVSSALNIPRTPVQADQLEASLIYTRFHGISSRSNRLLTLVQKRLHRGDAYHELLQQCRATYCSSREALLKLTVRAHMDKLKDQHGPVGMTRLASVFLIRLCTVETSLYLDFFGKKAEAKATKDGETSNKKATLAAQVLADDGTFYDSEFQAYLSSLCSALHRTIRRSLVTMLDLDTLCQIVSVLREERTIASSSPTTMAASRSISSIIQDAQERLIFCATTTLTKEVIRFKATPSDLNYPDKLVRKVEANVESATDDDETAEKRLQQVYESWFPPIRSILRILSKIFRVVEPKVFEDMALQSVQACTRCLKDGASYIKARKGEMHSDLFLVKHLLILREQLSPFDIELRAVERQLDFSDAGMAVTRFLANRNRRLFSMSTENALVTLLREGLSVQESDVDSKRDLEDALRSACNDFIDHTSKTTAGELLDAVEKCKSSDENSLARQAILSAESVEKLISEQADGFEGRMKIVTSQMELYLDNPATQNILLKPVSRKLTRALEDIRKMTAKIPEGECGWDSDSRVKVEELIVSLEQDIKRATRAARNA